MRQCKLGRTFGLLLLVIEIASSGKVSAQGLTLNELQQRAVANRRIVEKFRANYQQGELDTKIRRGAFLPALDVAYIANQLDEDTTFENKQNSRLTGVLSYNLFNGFHDKYGLQEARHLQASKQFELKKVIDELSLAVALRYLDAYRRGENEKIAEEQLKLLQKRYQDAEKRYSVGIIRKNDLLRIKVEMNNTEQRLTEARAEYAKSINQLSFTTSSAIESEALQFDEFEEIPEIFDFEYYYAVMLEKRPEIKILEALVLANENNAKKLKSDYWPLVDIGTGYSRFGDNFVLDEKVTDQDEFRVTLEARINLFDGMQKGKRVARARLETRKSEYDLVELKNELSTALKNILIDYEVGKKNLEVAASAILQAKESLRVSDIAYKEGVETSTELLESIFFYSRAQLNQIVARIDLFLNYYRLQRMIGEM